MGGLSLLAVLTAAPPGRPRRWPGPCWRCSRWHPAGDRRRLRAVGVGDGRPGGDRPAWSARLTGRAGLKPLADAVSVSAAAQWSPAPLIAGISGRFSLVAVAANFSRGAGDRTDHGARHHRHLDVVDRRRDPADRFCGPAVWWLLTVARWAAAARGHRPGAGGAAGVVVVGLSPRWRAGAVADPLAPGDDRRGRTVRRPGWSDVRRPWHHRRVTGQLHLVLGDEAPWSSARSPGVLRAARADAGTGAGAGDVPGGPAAGRRGQHQRTGAELLSPSLFADERVVVLEATGEPSKDAVTLIRAAAELRGHGAGRGAFGRRPRQTLADTLRADSTPRCMRAKLTEATRTGRLRAFRFRAPGEGERRRRHRRARRCRLRSA